MKSLLCCLATVLTFSLSAQQVELVIPTGHTRQIQDIVIDADTTFIASIQNGNEIILWDYTAQRQRQTLRYHQSRVNDLEIIGGKLWSASDDGTIQSWSLEQGKVITSIEVGSAVKAVKSFGNLLISITKDGVLKSWDLSGRESGEELVTGTRVVNVSNVINGQLLISSPEGVASLVDLATLKILNTTESGLEISALAITPGYLHVGTINGEVLSFDQDLSVVNRQQVFDLRLYKMLGVGNSLYLGGRGEQVLGSMELPSFQVSYPTFNLGDKRLLSQNGIRAMAYSPALKRLLFPDAGNAIREFQERNDEPLKVLKGKAYQIEDFDISGNEQYLAVASSQDVIQIHDLKSGRNIQTLKGHLGGVSSVVFHPTDTLLASVGKDDQLKIWSLSSGLLQYNFQVRGEYRYTHIQFDETGRYIIRKADQKYFELFKFDRSKSKKLTVEGGIDYKFAADGEKIIFHTKEGFKLYNSISLQEEKTYPLKGIKDFDVVGNLLVANGSFGIRLFNLNFSDLGQIKDDKGIDRIYLHPSHKFAIGTINSAKKGSSKRDYSLKVFDLEKLDFSKEISAHDGFVSKVKFLKGGEFTMTAASDGKIQIFQNLDNEPLGQLIPLDGNNWVTLARDGIYDAAANSFKMMHYMQGAKEIDLGQLKAQYFEPKLLPRLLGNIDEPLPQRQALSQLAPHPEMDIKHPNLNDGVLGVNLRDNGGGIGRILILINGKEVIRETGDARNVDGSIDFQYGVEGHPFLKANTVNKVTVKAYNEEGTLSTPEKNLFFFNEGGESSSVKANLYALIVGSGDYPGQSMDLNYAVKDAVDFSNALRNSAGNYFGADNYDIRLLHSDYADTSDWPTKFNIQTALKDFSKKASAQDYLLLYFSGHGMNYGKPYEDFYYLTAKATDEINDEANRVQNMVSSRELTDMIREVAALKQVLIFDACHSGKLADQIGSSGLSSGQVKAMESMKDRTGLYVIAGSESDAVSYETSLFQQGLLTYSLLFGMKGAALTGEGEVDIIDLLQFASKKVPELATEIGGVQLPEVRLPAEAESFAIGRMEADDRDKINLAGTKPIFIHSGFQEEQRYFDQIELGELVDQLLIQQSRKEDAGIIFLDKKQFGTAYQIRGRYRLDDEVWRTHVKIFKDENMIREADFEGVNAGVLAEKIGDWAVGQKLD